MDTPPTLPSTGHVFFTVSGAGLVLLARNLVAEGSWERGVQFLDEGLDGLGYDRAVAVLRGSHTLTGRDNDIRLAPQDPADPALLTYQAQLAWTYAGRFRQGESWFRPYAVVEDYGKEDAEFACQGARMANGTLRRGIEAGLRALHYANDPNRDLPVTLEYRDFSMGGIRGQRILFEPCGSSPLWWPRLDGAEAALADWVRVRDYSLDRRGWTWRYRGRGLRAGAALDLDALDLLTEHDRVRAGPPPTQAPSSSTAFFRAELGEAEQIEGYRARIIQAANALGEAGWMDLPECRGDAGFRVPRLPFINWALGRTHGAHLAPAYSPVCPSGLKMGGDNSYHTDWIVGAGLHPGAAYRADVIAVSYAAMHKVQEDLLGFTAAVLAGRGRVTGRTVHPEEGQAVGPEDIAVIPAARPGYEAAVRTARAVITATGGQACHLANVALEGRGRIVRVADCMTLYPPKIRVTVDCDAGRVEISDVG